MKRNGNTSYYIYTDFISVEIITYKRAPMEYRPLCADFSDLILIFQYFLQRYLENLAYKDAFHDDLWFALGNVRLLSNFLHDFPIIK